MAVIDIGSNALRLAIGQVGQVKEAYTCRYALRLGSETFKKGYIGRPTLVKLLEALTLFSETINRNKVDSTRVIATSALRDASNKDRIKKMIKDKLNLKLEIISGQSEAQIIFKAINEYYVARLVKNVLIMDIGGGSVELIAHQNKRMKAKSFPMGTVRLLAKSKSTLYWDRYIKNLISRSRQLIDPNFEKNLFFVGTGGNVRRLGKLAVMLKVSKKSDSISYESILTLISILQPMSLRQREYLLGLKVDRADVILPAAMVVANVMEKYSLKRMHIPNIGLKNGLLVS